MNWFKDRALCIATKHNKDSVIAPILSEHLAVNCFTPKNFDTDIFGTFTGEIVRDLSPIETAKKKCEAAHLETGCDLIIASEGSFMPHPTYFFMPCDHEVLVLMDFKFNFICSAAKISSQTNFSSTSIDHISNLDDFLNNIQFPSHGVIIKSPNQTNILKDINQYNLIYDAVENYINLHGSCLLETDMRAMNNPTRMKVIEELTHKLVKKVNSKCPSCNMPGFDVIRAISGLPCMACKSPTSSTLSLVKGCISCSHEELIEYPNNKVEEDPMYCNYCNP